MTADKRVSVRFSRSGNIGNPVRDFQEIVVDRLLDVAVELAALDGREDLQRLVDLGTNMDSGGDLFGVAKALSGDRIAAFAFGNQVAELGSANGRLF
ncbi:MULTISPECIES: hypothetical protein [unclassified Ensifer]|uniref:hypothetical protein n=1 Tax=unclassified Ensifer TaxID=2633371 RepID=UPI00138F84FA|nr:MULTISPECIES: hypothetical protein [unclassified Ensifer]